MASETTSNARTLKAYVSELLEYPRLIIGREVDFSDCRHEGHYNMFLSECVECRFGDACRWLDEHRTPRIDDAPIDELVEALRSAVDYLQSTNQHLQRERSETRAWIQEVRRFLRSHRGHGRS